MKYWEIIADDLGKARCWTRFWKCRRVLFNATPGERNATKSRAACVPSRDRDVNHV
jgi:hypothetical protein